MLTLNRPRRQALATLALLGFTVAPTAYVARLAWRANRPAHVREVEAEIGRRLGLRVAIASARHPRPGEDVLGEVVLRQEQGRGATGLEVARARSVRVRRLDGGMSLEAEGLRVRGESPSRAVAEANALLGRVGAEAASSKLSLSAPDCEVDLGRDGPRYRLKNVYGVLPVDLSAPDLSLSYLVPGERGDTRCELTLRRDRTGDRARTTLEFRNLEGPPPSARVLGPFFDATAWLGEAARLDGRLTLRQDGSAGWEAEFVGRLLDVDLASLVGRRFPDQRLTGRAVVEIASARWADRPGAQGFGWVEARGTIATGPGTIGAGLLRALKSEMSFRVQAPPLVPTGDVPFQHLGLAFAMTDDGEIRLDGHLGPGYPPDAVVVDARKLTPIASAPEGVANVRGLIRTLFPTDDDQADVLVPDTPESRLLRYLPAPPTIARSGDLLTN